MLYPRHCEERSDDPSTLAVQATPGSVSAEARRAKAEAIQLSWLRQAKLDYFASLAMTGMEQLTCPHHPISCNAPAIRASFWSIAATWPFSASICGPVAGSSAPTATPQAEHCTSVSLRVSPIGVNSVSSKLCPPHLPQVDIAISLSPDHIA